MATHELYGAHEQIIEIECRIILQTPLVERIDVRHDLIEAKVPRLLDKGVRIHQIVFQCANASKDALRRIEIGVDTQLFHTLSQQRQLIRAIVDDKMWRQTSGIGFTP